jgi:hypothetical protein
LGEVQEALALAENMRHLVDLVEARGRIVQDFSALSEEHEVFKDRIAALESQLAEAREAMRIAKMNVDGAIEAIVVDVSAGRARLKSELVGDELAEVFESLVAAQHGLAAHGEEGK